ncbi:MAG: hypothetical protein IK099_11095 [Clostridia bacterium]|nr:hypothetical protein [Clostridia bacterium]
MQLGLLKKKNPNVSSKSVLEKGWNCLRETFEEYWKRRFIVFALFILVFAAFCCYHFSKSLLTATTIVSLDYEEASKGLTPSHTRFNIFEIQSTEVMERLIKYAGLEGVITPDELSECIRVKATHNKNVSGKVNFISTSYIITFTHSDLIKERSVETMLSLLCKSYREFFVENYGINHSILSFDINDLKFNDEYLMAVDLLELKCNQLEKYVQLRKRENKNYQDPDTGITFTALEQRAKNFYTYDLTRLRSYIIESGIANDKASLNAILDYKIRMDRLVYDKLLAAYEEDNKGIKMYDTAMSAIVMIPTEDSSRKYYMSRTKTGMDNMALHADGQLYGASEKMQAISTNSYLIKKMDSVSPLAEQVNKADAMIRQIEASLEELASDIRKTDKAYTSYKARNYLSFKSSYERFMDRIDIISSGFGSAVLLFLSFIAVFLHKFVIRKKKVKKYEKI